MHVGRDEALVGRRVGQPQPADDVADRIDVRLLGPHPAVDLDDAAVGLDLGGLQADVLDVGGATGGDEHHLGPQLLRVLALGTDHDADAVLVGRDRGGIESGVGHDGHAALLEAAQDDLADLGVLERHDLRGVLEERHLHADVGEHRGELDADGARPDDDDVLGQRRHAQDVVAGDDLLAVGLEPGKALHARAGRDDDVGRLQDALAALAGRAVLGGLEDADLLRPVEAAAAGDPGHLVLVDQGLEPGPHPLHDLVAAGGHLRVVDDGLAGERQAEVLGVADVLGEGGRLEQRLGRDAAAMEARAADLVLVDERDLEPELARAEGRGIPARARAEHDEIEVIGRADGHGSGSLGKPRRGCHRADVEGLRGRVGHRGHRTAGVARGATEGDGSRGPDRGGLTAGPGARVSGVDPGDAARRRLSSCSSRT